jgi:hypothetical protein
MPWDSSDRIRLAVFTTSEFAVDPMIQSRSFASTQQAMIAGWTSIRLSPTHLPMRHHAGLRLNPSTCFPSAVQVPTS